MLQLCTILIVYFQDSRLMNDVLNYEVLTAIVHYTNNTHTLSAIYFHANNLMKRKPLGTSICHTYYSKSLHL